MRTLFLDCFSGISGDMAVGALIDLGLDLEFLKSELTKLGLDDEYHLHTKRESRHSLEGVKFCVHATMELPAAQSHVHSHTHSHSHADGHGHSHSHSHDHASPHGHGRCFREIAEVVETSALRPAIKSRILSTFRRIAVAEGKIHGMPPEDVTFHEVGAVDSIVDIAAFCIGLDALGIERILASRLVEGSGHVDCAHGRFPLPAPATLEILAGIPFSQVDESNELITPTGAALLAEFSEAFGLMPEMSIENIGYGIGTRDPASRANVLRAAIGSTGPQSGEFETDLVVELRTQVDDMTPEVLAPVLDRLLEAGALDAFFTPVQMKKGRPGILLTVLAPENLESKLTRTLFEETSAFGVRRDPVSRSKLLRKIVTVATDLGSIAVKLGFLGGKCIQAKPEFADCLARAHQSGRPLIQVHSAAKSAAAKFIGSPIDSLEDGPAAGH